MWSLHDRHHTAIKVFVPLCLVVQVNMDLLELDILCTECVPRTADEWTKIVSIQAQMLLISLRLGHITTFVEE